MRVTKEQLKDYSKMYEALYENGYASWLVSMGDMLMREHKEIAGELIRARQDLLTSDREVAAYAVWFMKYHNSEFLKKVA